MKKNSKSPRKKEPKEQTSKRTRVQRPVHRKTKEVLAELIEVGTHSAWVQEIIAGCGHEVLVANPRLMEVSKRRKRKNDRIEVPESLPCLVPEAPTRILG